MSSKCFSTMVLYALFLTFMVGTALIFSFLHFYGLIAKLVVIAILVLVSAALALLVEKGSVITILFNAILWGTALSFLFDNLGVPKPLHVLYVSLVMLAWFTLFCIFTNFSFVKENYAASMILWCVVLVVVDIVFAISLKNVLGWTSLILLVPFVTFFIAFPGEAESFTEHSHHIAIYSALPALFLIMLILFFKVPIDSYERTDFFPEIDDDYIFTYCPKQEDDEDDEKYANENLSEIL